MAGRTSTRSIIALAVLPLLVTAGATGQGRSTMVMDDGSGPRVMHFSQPDVDLVMRPDVTLADLDLFERTLELSDAQLAAVRRIVEAYLESFRALVDDHALAADREEPREMVRLGGPPAAAADEEPPPDAPPGGPGQQAEDPVRGIILEELRNAGFEANSVDDLPFRPQIEVGVEMADEGDGPVPTVNVGLSFGGEDDSMSEEVRDRLQAAADKIVPRITEHVRKRVESQMRGAAPGGPEAIGGFERQWAELEALRERIESFRAAKRGLWGRLVADVQALLAEPQLAAWPRFERALVRRTTLPFGRLDGERTDLLAVIEAMGVTEDERRSMADVLEGYELRLHEALVRRNELLEEVDTRIDEALWEGHGREALVWVDRVTRARTAVRSVNDETVILIAERLEPEDAASFHERVLETFHPQIYGETIGERAFDAVGGLDGLDPTTHASIAEMHEAYRREIDVLNERLRRTTRREQAESLRRSIESVLAMMEGEPPSLDTAAALDEELTAAFRRRQALDARTMRTLYAVLPPDRREGLPRIPVTDIAEPVESRSDEDGY
jgi:hypothetical protein